MLPDVEEQCSWGKPETAPSLFVKAKKDFHLLPLHNFTDCSRPGGRGVLLKDLGGVVLRASGNPYPI